MKCRLLFAAFSFLIGQACQAQDPSGTRFGKISPEDFAATVYPVDSNANAVVIADIGSTKMMGNSKGGFELEYKNFRRARIMNRNGYDIASVSISIYTDGDAEEQLINLRAVTYNLENGKVVQTKLEPRAAVFKDKIDHHTSIRRFTFPNIRDGSIIEYEYRIKSSFLFNLQPWSFQGDYPCLWSEYVVTIPEFYYYVTLTQGYQPFFIKEQKTRVDNFSIVDNPASALSAQSIFSANVTDFRWVMKDVPALREESYTSTLNNHIAKIEFQLAELKYPYTPENIMGNWTQASEQLLSDPDFGLSLDEENLWLDDPVAEIARNTPDSLGKARKLFAYVRDNLTCRMQGRTRLEKSLRLVWKSRNGNGAEINLLLVAMLRKAGLIADPVLLSTRSHGYAYSNYPLMNRFNHVIAQLTIDSSKYYLDASKPLLGFDKLDYACYNGHARVIDSAATAVEFQPDSLLERSLTSVFIFNDNNGGLSGSVQQLPGYYRSTEIREHVRETGKDALFSEFREGFNAEVEIKHPLIDSLDNFDTPVNIRYDFDLKNAQPDILYLNPLFGEAWKENPFKSAKRFYPVEMPYAMDETYLLRMDVPAGYVVDELPKQLIVKLNPEEDGLFEYLITESEGTITLRSRLRMKRTYFLPDEYEMLRQFFSLVVKKHGEQIVFKKKQGT